MEMGSRLAMYVNMIHCKMLGKLDLSVDMSVPRVHCRILCVSVERRSRPDLPVDQPVHCRITVMEM